MPSKAKTVSLALGGLIALLTQASNTLALDPTSTDARAIMQAASDQANGGNSTFAKMKMVIKQGSSTRERMMVLRGRRNAEGRKGLILIEAPADVRNTGFLTVDYKAASHADEQWLYLPALHRVSRVPNSGKSDAFVGSDFSISDLSGQEPSDYQLKIVEQSTKLGDDECWLIESLPKDDAVKAKTGYSKIHFWVSKSKVLPVQFKAWGLDGKKTKYFKATDIRKVDGLWTPHHLQMRTLEQGKEPSETVIDVTSVRNEAPEVTDADFTQQRLERGV